MSTPSLRRSTLSQFRLRTDYAIRLWLGSVLQPPREITDTGVTASYEVFLFGKFSFYGFSRRPDTEVVGWAISRLALRLAARAKDLPTERAFTDFHSCTLELSITTNLV